MHAAEELSEFTETALTVRGMDVRVFESDAVTGPGPSFVLIHGLGVSSRYFGPLARELSQYGRVLVLDLPGFGKTHDPHHALRIPGFAHVVNEVIRTLDVVEPVLVGHSMGTQVAVEALIRAPGLSRAALLAAPVVNDRERRAGLLMWRFAESAVKEPPSSAWDSIRGFLHAGPRWLFRDFGPMLTYRIEDRIPHVTVPITVVGGVGDHIAPPDWCARLAERCTDGDVVIVEGAAHQMIHTNPSEVANVALTLARFDTKRPSRTGEGGRGSRSPGAKPPGLPPCGD